MSRPQEQTVREPTALEMTSLSCADPVVVDGGVDRLRAPPQLCSFITSYKCCPWFKAFRPVRFSRFVVEGAQYIFNRAAWCSRPGHMDFHVEVGPFKRHYYP